MILYYNKYLVEEVYLFNTEAEFKNHLLVELAYDVVKSNDDIIVDLDSFSTGELIQFIKKYFNYNDGDFWKLMFRVRDGVGTQIDQNNPENDL
jgi:hypothetical protein